MRSQFCDLFPEGTIARKLRPEIKRDWRGKATKLIRFQRAEGWVLRRRKQTGDNCSDKFCGLFPEGAIARKLRHPEMKGNWRGKAAILLHFQRVESGAPSRQKQTGGQYSRRILRLISRGNDHQKVAPRNKRQLAGKGHNTILFPEGRKPCGPAVETNRGITVATNFATYFQRAQSPEGCARKKKANGGERPQYRFISRGRRLGALAVETNQGIIFATNFAIYFQRAQSPESPTIPYPVIV